MQKKSGKFMADWRDEKGKRHRKACATRKQAARLSRTNAAASAAKKDRQRTAPRARSSKPTRKISTPAATAH
jgi:hypothetical protein